MWPFRRKAEPAPASGPATVPAPVIRREWAEVPPLQRLIGQHPLTAPVDSFSDDLATHHDPSLSADKMGHQVSVEAPSGLVLMLARPSTRNDGPAMIPRPRVQRRVDGAAAMSGEWDGDAAASLETRPSPLPAARPPTMQHELPVVAARPGLQRLTTLAPDAEIIPATTVQRSRPSATPLAALPSIDDGSSMPVPPPAARLTLGQARRLGLGPPISRVPDRSVQREAADQTATPVAPQTSLPATLPEPAMPKPTTPPVSAAAERLPATVPPAPVPGAAIRPVSQAAADLPLAPRPSAPSVPVDSASAPSEMSKIAPVSLPVAASPLALFKPGPAIVQRQADRAPAGEAPLAVEGERPPYESVRSPTSFPLVPTAAPRTVIQPTAPRSEPTAPLIGTVPLRTSAVVQRRDAEPSSFPETGVARQDGDLLLTPRDRRTAMADADIEVEAPVEWRPGLTSPAVSANDPADAAFSVYPAPRALMAPELTVSRSVETPPPFRRAGNREAGPAGRPAQGRAPAALPLAPVTASVVQRLVTAEDSPTRNATEWLAPDSPIQRFSTAASGTEMLQTEAVGAGSAASPSPAPAAGQGETELEELAGKLYDRIRSRLKTELLVDRERAGFLTDLR